jgi:hypothetical protein
MYLTANCCRLQLNPDELKVQIPTSRPTAEKMGARSVSKHLMALAFLFLCSSFCVSQTCTHRLKEIQFTCESSTCSQDVIFHLPDDDGPQTIKYSCAAYNCCGELKTTFGDDGVPATVLTPEMQARIEGIAATSQVLVADCTGRNIPYTPRGQDSINLDRMLAVGLISR